jgi:short-subunit dehydrogenase
MAMLRAFAPVLKANGGGVLANVSSIAGLVSFPGIATYSASKAALHFLTMAARMELAGQKTQVLGIHPGPIDTDMARDFDIPRETPSNVAKEIIRALETGEELLFPDAYAKEMYALLRKDPKLAVRKIQDSFQAEAA